MRTLFMAAAAAFVFVTGASAASTNAAATPAGPYKVDANGKCHAANGQFVATALCKTVPAGPYKLDANGRCHAANGQFVAASYCKH